MKNIFAIIGIIILVVALIFGIGYLRVGYTRTVEKQQRTAERHAFEGSRSYIVGSIQQLARYKVQWEQADEKERKAIESTVRMQMAEFPLDEAPHELRGFLRNARGY